MKIIFISIFFIVFSYTTSNVRAVLIGGNVNNGGTQIVGDVTAQGPLKDDIGRNINNGGTQNIKALHVKNGVVVTDEEEANPSDDEMDEAWGRSDGHGFGKTKAKGVRHNIKEMELGQSSRGGGNSGHWMGWEDFERKFNHKDSDSEDNDSNSSNDSEIEKEAKETDNKNSGDNVQQKTGKATTNYWDLLKKVPAPFLNAFRNSFKGNSENVHGEEEPSRQNVLVPNINTGGGVQNIAPVTFGEKAKGNQIGGNKNSGGEQTVGKVTIGAETKRARVGNNKNSGGGKQTVGKVTIGAETKRARVGNNKNSGGGKQTIGKVTIGRW
ncbi:hypothetical protein niasHT_004272 [Heterodera trifolii]|uniref:Uncharacterized protein n=1 Tax=Heterodera trifolii TaxID=157864 RepID=A0ABD2LNT6_9BILA